MVCTSHHTVDGKIHKQVWPSSVQVRLLYSPSVVHVGVGDWCTSRLSPTSLVKMSPLAPKQTPLPWPYFTIPALIEFSVKNVWVHINCSLALSSGGCLCDRGTSRGLKRTRVRSMCPYIPVRRLAFRANESIQWRGVWRLKGNLVLMDGKCYPDNLFKRHFNKSEVFNQLYSSSLIGKWMNEDYSKQKCFPIGVEALGAYWNTRLFSYRTTSWQDLKRRSEAHTVLTRF